jgi:hypothetical protein
MTDVKVQTLTDLVQKYGKLFPEVLVDAVEPVYNFELEKVFNPVQLDKLRAISPCVQWEKMVRYQSGEDRFLDSNT